MNQRLRYRVAAHATVPAWRRWLPIARHEWSSLFRTRWGVALFLLCLLPGVGRLVMLLILSGVVQFGDLVRNRMQQVRGGGMAALDPDQVDFYLSPVLDVMPGLVFFLLLSSVVVARAIARDRATNALELLWTRGVSPLGYLAGKWLGPFLLMAMTTVVVPLTLWVTGVMLAEDWSRLGATWLPMVQALSGLGAFTGLLVAIGILLSSLPATPNAAVVLWSMLLVGTKALGVVFAAALHQPKLRSWLSIWDAGGVLVRAMGGMSLRDGSIQGAVVLLLTLTVGLAFVARRRLRLEAALA